MWHNFFINQKTHLEQCQITLILTQIMPTKKTTSSNINKCPLSISKNHDYIPSYLILPVSNSQSDDNYFIEKSLDIDYDATHLHTWQDHRCSLLAQNCERSIHIKL